MNTQFETSNDKYNHEWLTPPEIVRVLGHFDLDPCQPINPPWKLSDYGFTINDDGLKQDWFGRVFCNPPYDNLKVWLERCAKYGNCIAKTYARTDNSAFHEWVFPYAYGIFFFKGRIKSYKIDGTLGGVAGAGHCLIAYDKLNAEVLKSCNLKGFYIGLK